MASGEEMLLRLGGDDWEDNIRDIRAEHGKKAGRFIAEALGVSKESARRWMAAAGIFSSRKARPTAGFRVGLARLAAVGRLKRATFKPGNKVKVSSSSKGKDGRARAVEAQTGGIRGADMAAVVNALEGGRWEMAGEFLDEAVMDAYGGLGGALFDCDYGADAHWEL